MGSRTRPPCHEPTTALRLRSPERLAADLARYLAAAEPELERDWRDVMVGLAVYHDCARRLGLDPVPLFEAAGRARGPGLRELLATFARRTDVTLGAFGWRLAELDGEPCYQPDAGPRFRPAATVRR